MCGAIHPLLLRLHDVMRRHNFIEQAVVAVTVCAVFIEQAVVAVILCAVFIEQAVVAVILCAVFIEQAVVAVTLCAVFIEQAVVAVTLCIARGFLQNVKAIIAILSKYYIRIYMEISNM
jgi:hypothetical protein